jgi:hypothetical protein
VSVTFNGDAKASALAAVALQGIARHRLPHCPACESVGTIVELGACCLIQHWISLGGLWDESRKPGWRAERPRRPALRKVHG